jgi:hypothetical protein
MKFVTTEVTLESSDRIISKKVIYKSDKHFRATILVSKFQESSSVLFTLEIWPFGAKLSLLNRG